MRLNPGAVNSSTDRVGICLAGACAVHCVVTPLIAASLPLIGMTLADPRLEWAFLSVSLATSAITLATGCFRTHRQWIAAVPFALGAACLLGRRFAEDADGTLARVAVVAGAGLIVTAHGINIRLCRRAGARCCEADAAVTA